MHEMALMGEVRDIVLQEARAHGFQRVLRVVLEIGKLSGVQAQAMSFCFDVVMADSPAEGAALDIVEIPGLAWCPTCGAEVEIERRMDLCPRCGGLAGRVLQGTEMRVKDLEVD